MDEIHEKKSAIRNDMAKMISDLSAEQLEVKLRRIEEQLFEFANFMEAKIPLLYMSQGSEVATESIIQRSFTHNKIIVLPAFNKEKYTMTLMKVDDFDTDLTTGPRGVAEPNPKKCKKVPIDKVDIAIIPGLAFDEKGGRIGSGLGYYDRLIPKLSVTTRKVSLALEEQVISQVPMEPHDKYVDIIITDERVIYKI
ncbi:5-formyltetrahydrofolate cyclo-ligase [Desulfonema ishimotonii]|uniref:5-formyltetrahydrofolate cyclo-ligase n=1 Tax=Desulfonema ishimotonii TaxID=45657 RepID=A0A401G390_9BACT|nr:5-formyltetrahydrofolate cyclo-ligase [Desulfonema ishimotonii]GBC63709.1 5-formyltetrahydrofolate cyclo-ligase [Desulfonema ishimotonii]